MCSLKTYENEVDLIFKNGHELIPIEIKASQTFHPDFLKSIEYFKNIFGSRVSREYLIYTGQIEQSIMGSQLINYKNATKALEPRIIEE